MQETFSFGDYLLKLKHTMVANKLLGILHVLTQVIVAVSMLITALTTFKAGFFAGLGMLILMILLIPVASICVRFRFEMLAVRFSINANLTDLKQGLLWSCDGNSCDCGCSGTPTKPAPKKAPAKKKK